MKVQAFQDPKSKRVFLKEKDYKDFVAEQARQASVEQKRKELQRELASLDSRFLKRVRSLSDIPALAKQLYQQHFDLWVPFVSLNTTRQQKAVKVRSVQMTEARLCRFGTAKPSYELNLTLELVFSSSADKLENESPWFRSAPLGIRARDGRTVNCWHSGREQKRGNYNRRVQLRMQLTDFPELAKQLKAAQSLLVKRERQRELGESQLDKQVEQDPAYKEAQARYVAAQDAYLQAQAHRNNVLNERQARRKTLSDAFWAGKEFSQAKELAQLVAQFEGAVSSDLDGLRTAAQSSLEVFE